MRAPSYGGIVFISKLSFVLMYAKNASGVYSHLVILSFVFQGYLCEFSWYHFYLINNIDLVFKNSDMSSFYLFFILIFNPMS